MTPSALLGIVLLALALPAFAQQPFQIGGDPRVDPADFRITTFAAGLDFPLGMEELMDGSILVGVNPIGPGESFFDADGELWRLVDTDGDGVADGVPDVLYTGLNGRVVSVSLAGDLVVAANGTTGSPRLTFLRLGATATDPLVSLGEIVMTLPLPWSHITPSTFARETATPGIYELFFNLGSRENNVATTDLVPFSGLVSGTLVADSIHRIIIDDTGASPAVGAPELIATGLRNAFGMSDDPLTGDLYFEDNNADGVGGEPINADELNFLAAGDVGGAVEHFGFPDNYIAYRTGIEVGSGGVDPLVAFQPIPSPNGDESQGPAEVAFAPRGFPDGLDDGIFVGFHGLFSAAGQANPLNVVAYADADTLEYFHFIASDEPDVGHPDGLLATRDSLYIADLTQSDFGTQGAGAIYQIRGITRHCDDGADNDADGFVDDDDPGCRDKTRYRENPACNDGIDNDGDLSIDADGGAAANGGVPLAAADPHCGGQLFGLSEAPKKKACGMVGLLPLATLFVRTRRRRSPPAAD